MIQSGISLAGSYDLGLVVLSVIIAIVASYTALDLAGRVTAGMWPIPPMVASWWRLWHGNRHLVDALQWHAGF